jgi:hypothetical protein
MRRRSSSGISWPRGPGSGFSISALAYNLIQLDTPLAPTIVGGGAGFQVRETLTLGADVLFDVTSFMQPELTVGGGIEYLVAGEVPLRFGYAYDAGRGEHTLTGGIGYIEQRVGVELGLRQSLEGPRGTEVLLALRYFVH